MLGCGRGGKEVRKWREERQGGMKERKEGNEEKCTVDNFDGLLKLSDDEQQANFWESQAQGDPAFL